MVLVKSAEDTEQLHLKKNGVTSAELATAVWSDVLRFTAQKMGDMDADTFEIEVEVNIRDDE